MDCKLGKLVFYKLDYEKAAQQTFEIGLEPGSYGIGSTDNILILENYDKQESYVFDIKSEIYFIRPFATIIHGMPNRNGEISLFIDIDTTDELGNFNVTFLYDGVVINNKRKMSHQEIINDTHFVDSLMLLDTEIKYVDNEVGIDFYNKKCYKLNVKPEILVKDHPDQVEAILFLLRRTGYKAYTFEYIKQCLRNKIELFKISSLFTTLNRTYKIAALERKRNPQKDDTRKSSIFGSTVKQRKRTEPELKIEAGMTVILQSDMHGAVFSSLFKEHIDLRYLTDIILLYHKSLIEEDIQVHQQLQILMARVLIRSRNFSLLHQLIQFHVFTDNLEFANLMIALSHSTNALYYSPGFQIGVDMLYRLEAWNALAEALVNSGMVFEAIKVLETHPSKEFDISLLVSGAHNLADPHVITYVSQFINQKLL